MVKCRKCGKQITFVKTAAGSSMPVEVRAVYGRLNIDSNFAIINANGALIRVDEVPRGTERAIRGWIPHWAVCQNAVQFRKERAAAKAERKAREEAARIEALQPKQITMF